MDTTTATETKTEGQRQPCPWPETRQRFLGQFHQVEGPLTWEAFRRLASRAAIHRHLRRLHEEGLIEPVDRLSVKGQGKAAIVWAPAGYRPRRNQTDHDVKENLVKLAIGLPTRQGTAVDPTLDPDWEWILSNDDVIYGELDTGSMSYRELVEERFKKYETAENVVVWISCGIWGTRDLTRLAGMRERAGSITRVAWFTTFGDVLERGRDAVLMNHEGKVLTFQEMVDAVTNPETNPGALSQPGEAENTADRAADPR
jgi:hypothetical protein